jgi:hypothetical protein
MYPLTKVLLFGLQCCVVLFMALHNWIPFGKLNDLRGVRKEFPGNKLLITTLINFTPYAFGLAASAFYLERRFPGWLFWWLWIRLAEGVVDSISVPARSNSRRALSSHAWSDAHVPARA